MQNQEFVFTPLGDPPTINNIAREFFIISAILIVGYVILYFASRLGMRTFNLIFYGIFLIAGLYFQFHTKYIKVIKIDTSTKKLSYDYLTITGLQGRVIINILTAKYAYKFYRSRNYSGCILILKDKDGELKIEESRRPNKRSKNVLSITEMNRMDSVIMQIKDSMNPQN